jgi:hypothetical protein
MSEPESLEQIAERLARPLHCLPGVFRPTSHAACIAAHSAKVATIFDTLREIETRGEQRAAKLGGTLLDSAVERAGRAEADLKAANSEISFEARRIGEYIEAVSLAEERAGKAEATVAVLCAAATELILRGVRRGRVK